MNEAQGESLGFIDFFKQVPDHRIARKKLYPAEELLLLTFCGMISGCDSWEDLELYGEIKLDELKRYLPYKNGYPSDDTLRRFFRALDAKAFENCFVNWVKSFQLSLAEKVIALDGKTSRRSFDGENRPMHLVSAFASELGITLGQVKTAEKSNEITAIPELLELLDIVGATVTIDAMGCQTKIVEKIVEKQADYVISLKGNQGSLNNDTRLFFESPPAHMQFKQATCLNKGHGRLEERLCRVTDDIQWLTDLHPDWKNLKTIIEITGSRQIKEAKVIEKRYYISSLPAEPEKIAHAIRQHWGIENQLHWVLDVCFNDDQSRIRKGNAPQNIAIIKKTALNLLQIVKKTKPRISLKRMRKLAGWDADFLNTVLNAHF